MSAPLLQEETALLRDEIKRLRKALSELTPGLHDVLKRRGFRVYRKEPSGDLILPGAGFVDGWYEAMKKYSFRLFLRDVIKHQDSFGEADVTRYATSEVTADYIEYLMGLEILEEAGGGSFRLRKRPIKSFGETLEWFVAETFKREFALEALRGVKFKRPLVGGDYDVIAKINGSVLYMEVKSSPPRQIYPKEIAAFLDRVEDLRPEVSVFFMDTELRMKDKIVPMFEEELERRGAHETGFRRLEKELFHLSDEIFIINAKDSIAGNIEKLLGRHFRRKR